MKLIRGRNAVRALSWVVSLSAAWALVAPSSARAEDAKVDVQAEVVLASNQGSTIEPPDLAKMKNEFMRSGLAFTSYRRIQTQRLSLQKGKPVNVDLPNHKPASIQLESVKEGTARVQVQVAKLGPKGEGSLTTTVKIGREGSVFIQAGSHEGGKLVLVLSAAGADAAARPSGGQ